MISLISSLASALEFTTINQEELFIAKQNETFTHFVNVSGNEGEVSFETSAHDSDVGFDCFHMSQYCNDSALINFTPQNKDVGNYSFIINAEDEEEITSVRVNFTVENLNTPPEIISTSPEEPVVAENSSIMLYANATDDDIIHGSNLTYNWYLNDKPSNETDGKLDSERININQTKANYSPRIEDFDAGMHNITVEVEDWENETANHTWGVNVTNVNRPPELNETIKEDGLTWEQDTNLTGEEGIDLTEYFHHPDTNGTLEIVTTGFVLDFGYNFTDEDFDNITIEITKKDTGKQNASAIAEFYPEEGWHGEAEVQFQVYDGMNEPVKSNWFDLNVKEVFEPPEVEEIDNQTAHRYAPFSHEVYIIEEHGDITHYEIESETLENITINDHGEIEFYTEDEEDIGNHTVNVTVGNEHELNTSELFELEVKNNTRPYIHSLEDLSVEQHNFSYFNVTGEDDFSESINFTTNLTELPTTLDIEEDDLNLTSEEINDTAWNFSFKPVHQKLVGNHSVGVYAEDKFGAINNETFELEIINVPTPPNLSEISVPNDQIKVNTSFQKEVRAFDMEGNIVEFSDNSSLFNISTIDTGSYNRSAKGNISFTPNETGLHNINISVNDSDGQKDWTNFKLNITENHEPFITEIENITTTLDESYSQEIKARVFDWQDELELYQNATNIGDVNIQDPSIDFEEVDGKEMKTYRWIFEFQPDTFGDYEFYVGVSDDIANDTITLTANISDVPSFIENVSEMEEWDNLIEGEEANINITAESHEKKQEGEELDMSANVINFTSMDGEFHNKTEFESSFPSFYESFSFEDIELDDNDRTRGTINFTPEFENAGRYWVNISADDDETVTSEIFSFEIDHLIRPIEINWSYEYPPTGDSFSSNESEALINCKENETINFNATINNPNKEGMNISLYEIKDSNETLIEQGEVENHSLEGIQFSYDIPFYAHPNITLKFVADDKNTQTNVSWILNATNVNRDVRFGKIALDLNEEEGMFNNTLIKEGNLVLDDTWDHDEGAWVHHENGSYVSPVMDIGFSNTLYPRFRYENLNIVDLNKTDDKYNITYYTATGEEEDFEPEWQEAENRTIQSENSRYIRYKVEIEAKNSSVTNVTPSLEPSYIKYHIDDQKDFEGTEYFSWIDLYEFFEDPDNTDLSFEYEILEGEGNIDIIKDGRIVDLHFLEEGISIVQFNATDEYNSTAYSNKFEIDIETGEGENGGDDNGETRVETRTVTETVTETETEIITDYITEEREVEDPVALDIIHPEDVTIYENETISVPVTLKNDDRFTLEGLNIDAYPEKEGLNISLKRDYIEKLEQDSEEEIELKMEMQEIQESYNVVVEVSVDEPEYEDSTKILISPLTRAREGEEDARLRMAFVTDLLERHQECAELEQYIERAMDYMEEDNHERANELLDDFIHDCRILIEDDGIVTDQPQPFTQDIISYIKEDRELLSTLILIAFLFLITLGIGLGIGYRKI